MSALHTHTLGHTQIYTPCLELPVLLLHSGELNFTLLPPVTHTDAQGVILNRVIMNGAGKEPIKSM